MEGNELPRLVYVSREKRPGFQHHKKAGAMNALVSTRHKRFCGSFIFLSVLKTFGTFYLVHDLLFSFEALWISLPCLVKSTFFVYE